jgi:HAD superfamily phosphatase
MEITPSIIVFDMDGVLVEVTESYRAAIIETIRFFTGQTITNDEIQGWKNRGGYNNDWVLCHHFCRDAGFDIDYPTVVDQFNEFFFGTDNDGLILREKWVPRDGLLERLATQHRLAIFTGRDRREADFTLKRFASAYPLDPIVTTEDVTHGKPHPEGLLLIRAKHPNSRMLFIGDTVDDARSASAARVPFIGIASPETPRRDLLVAALQSEGAIAVLENINQLEGALPQ